MSVDKPQYQHFIPQFILRNFDYPFVCPIAPLNGRKCKKHQHDKGKYPGDRVVNCLQLLPEGFKFEEQSIKRVCGLDDMYTDKSPMVESPRELEVKFSKLEAAASPIIRKIIASHQRGDEHVKITRTQQTILRKFVYLLKQRNLGFFKTYNYQSINDYKGKDKDLLKEFMEKRGIQHPIDVWLQGLSAIIDVDMSVSANWRETLQATVYYALFVHFEEHITGFWMSFCTPSSEYEEFILPDTASTIYEGPTVDFQDQKTGEFLCLGPQFHLFIPISPRLMIVLRSQHLPEPHEDANPELKARRQQWRQIFIDSVFGTGTKSILEDLPVHKALNNYSTYVNGRGMGRPGRDGQLRQTDSFLFPFFKISTRHIRAINGLLLDHAFHTLNIIFFQKGPFLDLLEWYLTEPCEVGKRLSGEYAQDKKRYIEQLVTFMVAEGRNVTAKFRFERTWHDLDIEAFKKQTNATARWLEERESSHAENENTGKKGKQISEPETDGSLEDTESRTVLDSGTTDNHQPKDEPLKNVAARWLEELGDSHNNNKGKNVENEETPPHEGDAKFQDTAIQKGAESMTKADDEPNLAEKVEDNPLENEWIAAIYNLVAEKWKSPHVISDDETKALNLKKSLVMIHVWLRNAELDSADDRLETLLEGYQSRQPPVVFWLFLKRFRNVENHDS
ncbi:hypothetical protein FMUND_12208 [Fusarium mundagurra]|uniref:DUF4238 domain-containing protein n=1 Tax=Fusarium mundagurra TaxID=1567541 RepID=A0A8H5Y3I2_9HYPO|nr:hypothetical protein FMUND_12208 [Fusarium mundagurra]